MKKLRWLAILMGIAILAITGFQGYWLNDSYKREKQNLELKTNVDFRQAILKLQASKLHLEMVSMQFDSLSTNGRANGKLVVQPGRRKSHLPDSLPGRPNQLPMSIINLLQEKAKNFGDSGTKKTIIFSGTGGKGFEKILSDSLPPLRNLRVDTRVESMEVSSDSLRHTTTQSGGRTITINYGNKQGKKGRPDSIELNTSGVFYEKHDPPAPGDDLMIRNTLSDDRRKNSVFRFLYNIDSVSIKDSVTVKEINDAYATKLREEKINGLDFAISRLDSNQVNSQQPNEVTIGFAKPVAFRLSLENEMSYLLKKLTLPILFSLFLVGITVISFVLLYRNLVRQRRLAELKNEFISNITHELKTPIATVGVAIEALKNFNAIHDPQRTKEYLDISQNELQRLSLLVDKVLKLSMFEKKEMELKKEQFDCKRLTEEVMNSMRLQFEKYHAKVNLYTEGDNFVVEADKLHITSVIYNLLDNALKYSRENPVIDVWLKSNPDAIEFSVSDNGIGIPPAYREKVFDKFFRVPTGDKHNIKGYGLGLSYVAEVIKRHQGNVRVESELGKGSTFTARFPYA
jgi:two-component system phosphate regulon sensor histidine kinase PhoR